MSCGCAARCLTAYSYPLQTLFGGWNQCAKATSNADDAADRARDAANGYVMRQHNTTNGVLLARGDESALQLFCR